MREVAIIGVGMNAWGELWDLSLRDVFVQAALPAIRDSGVTHIDSLYVGWMASGMCTGKANCESLSAGYLCVAALREPR